MPPKDVERMVNSVNPDQTAPEEQFDQNLHCFGAQTYMSQYLEFLRYVLKVHKKAFHFWSFLTNAGMAYSVLGRNSSSLWFRRQLHAEKYLRCIRSGQNNFIISN